MRSTAELNCETLAIEGGKPRFSEPVYVGTPNLPNRDILLERIEQVFDRNWLSNFGPFNHEFAAEIRKHTRTKHAIPVANGTIGLELAIRAAGLKGEVIVPAFTFVATAHALQWQGIKPVFCDVDPKTHCIDPGKIEALITPKTTGILGVHLWGTPCDTNAIDEIAKSHGLKVLYDAAHGFGVAHEGTKLGNFGAAEVFSFHATKFVNSLEGGAVVTNSDELADRVALMSNFGFTAYDRVEHIGTNGKLNEVAAAVGISSLQEIDSIVDVNRLNYEAYRENLSDIPGLSLYEHKAANSPNYQYIVVEVDEHRAGLSRDQLLTVFHAENVIARRYFYPGCHRMQPYEDFAEADELKLIQTERLCERVMCLPTGNQIGPSEVARICGIAITAVNNSSRLSDSVSRFANQKPPAFGGLKL